MIFSYLLNMQSHPSWVCGLKLSNCSILFGRWRHTLRGCVDWNSSGWPSTFPELCHTLRGCVDWNLKRLRLRELNWRHTLRGCVDWNWPTIFRFDVASSHTLRGCVDWNYIMCHTNYNTSKSHPSWVCGLKLEQWISSPTFQESHPSWVCGLKHSSTIFKRWITRHTLRGCVDWNWGSLLGGDAIW